MRRTSTINGNVLKLRTKPFNLANYKAGVYHVLSLNGREFGLQHAREGSANRAFVHVRATLEDRG